ncbi:molybdopterin-dependent oxidoreductase [Pseudomonadales bacterium]|nr:molybdopterin-dependent oxidoreductase [Pseudomonadales bacterium]MDC1307811.1 molybdopterin-dependent oxidoreductase [Pseudomonadales bacterium]
MSAMNMSRRQFLKTTGILGGGLVIGFSMTGCSSSELPIVLAPQGFVPNAFLQIMPDNGIRFYCPRDEMGQGVTTGLSTLIGEELDVHPKDMVILFAGVHSDYNNPDFGVQGTGGSSSLKAHYLQLRQVGANTRGLLVAAAAQDLGVPASAISTRDGHIVVAGQQYPYGQFVQTAAGLEAPTAAPMKSNNEFRYIGQEFARVDAAAKSTGTAEFGIDIDIPNMHHAVVRRSPVAGAKLKSVDKSAALNMPGVTDVIEISSGVAVVAEKYWQAKTAAAKLAPVWEEVALSKINSSDVRADYNQAMQQDDGVVDTDEGDVQAGLAAADHIVEAEYWAPFLAHAPLEPMNAVVRIENGEADVWSGTQGIVAAQGLVSRFSGIPVENVRAHNTYLGGAFGRRGTLTHVIEATEVAVASNKPIHLLWSREDDIQNGVYRPASLMKIKAGVKNDGRITAWQAKRVGGNITPKTLQNMMPALFPGLNDGTIDFMVGLSQDIFAGWMVDHASVEGLYEDYDTDNKTVNHVTVEHDIPLTFWRSVGHSYTSFAKEGITDELAEKAGMDPVAFRLKNTQGNPRLQNVIRVAQQHMRTMQPAEGRFLGFAAHNSFATDVAEIAEVSVVGKTIRVHKVTCIVDCGIAVNPDIVRGQMEGAVMFGLTAALYGDLELAQGAFKQSNFHDYPILKMSEAPQVEVIIIDSGTAPTGVGEPGLPPIAPAVASAVYQATGQRLRSLPLKIA